MTPPLPDEKIIVLAECLHRVYRKWAGNMGLGDHLPETWWAVARAALQTLEEEAKQQRAERILASRLLDVAAQQFHEHGCNDMDPEYFEDLSPEEIAALEVGYNAWRRGETGETCGDPEDDYVRTPHIGDDMWMAYLATVIGREIKL